MAVTSLSSPITTMIVFAIDIAAVAIVAIVFMSFALIGTRPALSLHMALCVYLRAALRLARVIHHIFRSAESLAIVKRRPRISLRLRPITITHHAIPMNNCSRCLFVTRTVTAASYLLLLLLILLLLLLLLLFLLALATALMLLLLLLLLRGSTVLCIAIPLSLRLLLLLLMLCLMLWRMLQYEVAR